MNKTTKIILAVLGGIDVTIYILTPIILSVIWMNIAGLENSLTYLFFALAGLSTLFRSIKIGFMKDPEADLFTRLINYKRDI